MVFESLIPEMLQNQASRFLRGFSGDQLKVGLLSGRVELQGLALNPEPLDSLLLESEIPLIMKAGVLNSVVAQIALLQGELELTIDGLILSLGPACRWLTRTEVFSHRLNEIQRLEFVHMRSQSQRRNLEREMFRKLFSDYLSRLKIVVKNVHIRVEVEGEVDSSPRGRDLHSCFGIVLGSSEVVPVKGMVVPPDKREKDKDPTSSELLLTERINVKGFTLYHEMPEKSKVIVSWAMYHATRNHPLGVFERIKQDLFVRLMEDARKQHAAAPLNNQLVPLTNFSVAIEMRSQPIRDGFQVDSCLTLEITVRLEGPSRIHSTMCTFEHLQWFVRRTLDFQLWQFLHPVQEAPQRAKPRWALLRSFVALKRRIHSNSYALSEAITMRIHCKEYVRLYKKKFNGPGSVVQWRKSLPPLTHADAVKLSDIELVYPADKLVNFRLMAHAELKTEMALNSFLNTENAEGEGQYRRQARELTPLEQLHLHGQHGYGVNIYRGLPPPPSSLKIRIDIQAPKGLWWVCRFSGNAKASGPGKTHHSDIDSCWTVAVDCVAQPVRLLLVDSIVDASVFVTCEVAAPPYGQRPCGLLLGRTAAAFADGSPGRASVQPTSGGGRGPTEWCSFLELDGTVYFCGQLKTVLTSSPNSPWDIFVHFSCGDSVASSPNGQSPLEGFGTHSPPRLHSGAVAGTPGDENTSVRIRVPLAFGSGQAGPLLELLRYYLSPAKGLSGRKEIRCGPAHSVVAWLAHRIGGMRDVAVLRVHLRLPPTLVEVAAPSEGGMWLPRCDACCHLEHGGLVDGFAVGLHNLRHFTTSLASAAAPLGADRGPELVGPPPTAKVGSSGHGGPSHRGGGPTPWSVQSLEQAPPLMLLISALGTAFALSIASRPQQAFRNVPTSGDTLRADGALQSLVRKHELLGIVQKSDSALNAPAAAVTLTLVMLAVAAGRRALWDFRDAPHQSGYNRADDGVAKASAAVGEIHRLAGAMLRAMLSMGFSLHPRCLPLAAWAGGLDMLEAVSMAYASTPAASAWWQESGLVLWAARGAYTNLPSRQDEVVRWLLRQQAKIDERDKAGRSILEWACWAGDEGLVSLALRAGLLSVTTRTSGPAPAAVSSPASMPSSPAAANSPLSPLPSAPLPLASPLTLAVASRSQGVVSMLLRAAGDPHTPARGTSCGPLLLAARTCEYEIASQVLQEAAFVSVEAALGSTHIGTTNGTGSPSIGRIDNGDPFSMAACVVRATIALVDSLRRFAGSLARRSEDVVSGNTAMSLRSQLPGSHPDEGLYATGQMPFNDILHPLVMQLPLPVHKVSHELRPHTPPHRWRCRTDPNPWAVANHFVDGCLQRGFRPDSTVVTRALPALPLEARQVVQHLLLSDIPPGVDMMDRVGGVSGQQWYGMPGTSLDQDMRPGHNAGFGEQPQGSELTAAISFAKEIRDIFSRRTDGPPDSGHEVMGGGTTGDIQEIYGEPTKGQIPHRRVNGGGPHPQVQNHSLAPRMLREPVAHWDAATFGREMTAGAEVLSQVVAAQGRGGSPALPAVRVVVLGAPRAGKSSAARCILNDLNVAQGEGLDGRETPAWLGKASGTWPASGRPRAEVRVWDGASAPMPGLLSAMAVEPAVPILVIIVLDGGLVGFGSPSEAVAGACAAEVLSQPNAAPRGVLLVENFFGRVSPTAAQRGGNSTTRRGQYSVKCSLQNPEGAQELRRTFNHALGQLVSEVEARGAAGRATQGPLLLHQATSNWRGLVAIPGQLGGPRSDDPALAWMLRGDSVFIDPGALSWAWATIRSAQGYLCEGTSSSSSCGGTVVPLERLERLLSSADTTDIDGSEGAVAASLMLRALVDLGLVCPIPNVAERDRTSVASTRVLIPDFARRVRLTPDAAARLVGDDGGKKGEGSSGPPLSARILWDNSAAGAPSLRAALRDFCAAGVIGTAAPAGSGAGVNATASRAFEARRFVLLEAGPTGAASESAADGLGPGFLFVFDLVARLGRLPDAEMSQVCLDSTGAPATKPPPSIRANTPSGNANAGMAVLPTMQLGEEELLPGAASHLTALIVGASEVGAQKGGSSGAPFWDVYCIGPHAQWGLRAFLSSRSMGQGFSGFRCTATKAGKSAAQGSSSPKSPWPLAPPSCVLTQVDEGGGLFSSDAPTPVELVGFSWLFNGPTAATGRTVLRPTAAGGGGALAQCCAALFGKASRNDAAARAAIEDNRDVRGLPTCADFEAALLSRNFRELPRLLDEVLAAGAEAWALCAASLARVAHDAAAIATGVRGQALPLLGSTDAGSGPRVVVLVPDGPPPIALRAGTSPAAGGGASLGPLKASSGMEAWLRLCRPAALWSAAGAARGYCVGAPGDGGSRIGEQVTEALRVAIGVRLVDGMVAEVWEALQERQAENSMLAPRPGGKWVHTANAANAFELC